MGPHYHLILLVLLLSSSKSHSWSLFTSSSSTSEDDHDNPSAKSATLIGKFSIEGHDDDPKAIRLVEDAEKKLAGPNSCWHLSDCFQRDSAMQPFPSCDHKSTMFKCLKLLNDDQHKVYLEFYLETNSICQCWRHRNLSNQSKPACLRR